MLFCFVSDLVSLARFLDLVICLRKAFLPSEASQAFACTHLSLLSLLSLSVVIKNLSYKPQMSGNLTYDILERFSGFFVCGTVGVPDNLECVGYLTLSKYLSCAVSPFMASQY